MITDAELFDKFFSGGHYALPYLIKLSHPTAGTVRLVNNNESVLFDGDNYEACAFDYTPPDMTGGSASLKVTGIDNTVIEFVENADWRYRLDVVGVIAEDGAVQRIRNYVHFLGSVTYADDMQIQFNLGRDERLDMMFCPYTYDADNNRANA